MVRSGCAGGASVAEFTFGGGYGHFEVEGGAAVYSCSESSLNGNLDIPGSGECSSCSAASIYPVHVIEIKVGEAASESSTACVALIKRLGIGPAITFKGDGS